MHVMDCGRSEKYRKTKQDQASILRKSWNRLRLSVHDPERVPTWDAIVVTASSSKQAQHYSRHLLRATLLGRISPSTVAMAAPDPNGLRIGSGAATLNAIDKLAGLYFTEARESSTFEVISLHCNESNIVITKFYQNDPKSLSDYVKDKHILLIHAGGDSKRVPWANSMGKVFLPLPFLASDDPDGPGPLLFDHILAIASCARQALKNEGKEDQQTSPLLSLHSFAYSGGIMIMTGDVLPCFDASELILPDDSSCIITAPVTVDIAANHGVVVASKSYSVSESHPLLIVDNLLQKPSLSELTSNNAVLEDGRTLVDTGVIAVRGSAWANLAALACSSGRMIVDLVATSNEMGLYEELVAAWVPARHDWLRTRPMGEALLEYLGNDKMHTFCAYDLKFLHFGTSGEVLDHLSEASSELMERRHLSIIPASDKSDVSPSAVILSSILGNGVSVADDSLIFHSTLYSGTQIGPSTIVVNFEDCPPDDFGDKFSLVLPPRHCLWEVSIEGGTEKVIVVCGLYDNPKVPFPDGTFCGRPWMIFLQDTGVEESDLWGEGDKCLWNAKIFPVLPKKDMLKLATWLMGNSDDNYLDQWRGSRRMSMEAIHKLVNFEVMEKDSRIHISNVAAGICAACFNGGLLGRNLSKLGKLIWDGGESTNISTCKDLIDRCDLLLRNSTRLIVPKSRVYQVQHDLLKVTGDTYGASLIKQNVWWEVGQETADAVRFLQSPTSNLEISDGINSVKVELPVRVDFAGGWSDTPPWSLERTGCVLNMAIKLEGRLPIGALIEATKERVVELKDDAGNHEKVSLEEWSPMMESDDPFKLVKSALLVSGMARDISTGLKITTWARVPRGSGLGTSSILSAAVVKGLMLISGKDSSNESVANLVLVLEQFMGTGGGWQDQIGGLYPGIKFTRSLPGVPLRLQVTRQSASPKFVKELEERLLVVFTGQVRDGREVVEKVMAGYLRREKAVVESIKRAAELASRGREAVMEGSVDQLAAVIRDTWDLHQLLYPSASTPQADRLFQLAAPHCCAYKLLGAGAGGFALLLAHDSHSASLLSTLFNASSPFTLYSWSLYH